MKRRTTPVAVRFLRYVDLSRGPHGCWLWTGALSVGYGVLRIGDRSQLAHRVAASLVLGRLPKVHVCHRCDVPRCVNPAHLFLGTQADNVRDMFLKRRNASGERHGSARLTDAQVCEMRALHDAGWRAGPLAKRFGIVRTYAQDIIDGRRRRRG